MAFSRGSKLDFILELAISKTEIVKILLNWRWHEELINKIQFINQMLSENEASFSL